MYNALFWRGDWVLMPSPMQDRNCHVHHARRYAVSTCAASRLRPCCTDQQADLVKANAALLMDKLTILNSSKLAESLKPLKMLHFSRSHATKSHPMLPAHFPRVTAEIAGQSS